MFDRHAREFGQLDLIAAIQRQSLRLVEDLREKSHCQKEPQIGFYVSSSGHSIPGTELLRCLEGLASWTAMLRHSLLGLPGVRSGSPDLRWPLGTGLRHSTSPPTDTVSPGIPTPNPPCLSSSQGAIMLLLSLIHLPLTDSV